MLYNGAEVYCHESSLQTLPLFGYFMNVASSVLFLYSKMDLLHLYFNPGNKLKMLYRHEFKIGRFTPILCLLRSTAD